MDLFLTTGGNEGEEHGIPVKATFHEGSRILTGP